MMKTDAEVKQDVLAELKWEPSINASGIGVEVKNGIVTLVGHVASYTEKWNAENAAQRIYGVKAFATEIRVDLPESSIRSDGDIAYSVQNTLEWQLFVPKDSYKIMVENGWVKLTGQVEWEYQRKIAINAIRGLKGVVGVINEISIKPKLNSIGIKSDIDAALKRRANKDSKSITVDVHNDVVTLSGCVQSWSERDLATSSAWASPGVASVINNIEVSN